MTVRVATCGDVQKLRHFQRHTAFGHRLLHFWADFTKCHKFKVRGQPMCCCDFWLVAAFMSMMLTLLLLLC